MVRKEILYSEDSRNKPEIFSLAEEPRKFFIAFHQHWPLVLGIGLFFGWLLSFPMQGPLFGALVRGGNISPLLLITLLLVGHILGLTAGGIAGHFYRRIPVWFSLGAVPCVVISWLITAMPEEIWWLLFIVMGISSGAAIISWASAFITSVPQNLRARTFVLAAALSNIILYLVNILSNHQAEFTLLLRGGSLLALSMPVFLIYNYLKTPPESRAIPAEKVRAPQSRPLRLGQLFPFIFTIYAVGGLMYAVIGSLASPPSGILGYYELIPYILLLFLAGFLADRAGRRISAVLGAIAVGIGFMSIGIFTGSLQFVLIQTFLVGGYAFLDVFTWVIAADISGGRKTPLFFSAVLGTNVLAILTGVLLGDKLRELATGSEVLTVCLAGIFSFVSLTFMIRLRETLQSGPVAAGNLNPDSVEAAIQKFGLTPRESEVVKLLIDGDGTREIREKLVIAPDTLKSHLRNIYRKAGVRNRLEFTMAVMNDFDRTKSDPETG